MRVQIRSRAVRWLVSGVLYGAWSLAFQAGCSSSSGRASCQATCSDLCQALAACDDAPTASDCEAQCSLGLGNTDCSQTRPADQLTCSELSQSYACVDYCATLCTRAPDCGSFDQAVCANGCAGSTHEVCNAKSVAARSCDQLKPELRHYDDLGRAGPGEVFGGSPLPGTYGLCTSAAPCADGQGCSPSTSTCGTCQADAECDRGSVPYACESGVCTQVSCVNDADCSLGRFCETTRHVCGECQSDADCPSKTSLSIGTVCDPATLTCTECLTNQDCAADRPVCKVLTSTRFCTLCSSDADCADRDDTPYCSGSGCVAKKP